MTDDERAPAPPDDVEALVKELRSSSVDIDLCMKIADVVERIAREREEVTFDLQETLKAVLHFGGPKLTNQVTTHVMEARAILNKGKQP